MSTHPPTANKPSVTASAMEHDALPAGTRFGEFEILRVLGVGGFGIVYLARDHSLERDVALKEYMPASLAARGAGPQITVRSSSFAETYAIGLRSFINEARLLARFDHPSLVKVYRFWEDNATAYMVMPYLQGITLRDMRRRMSHPPDEAWVKSLIMPILSALELLHREGVYHRDIAPDNILLPPDAAPVLLDFGAARRVISDRTQSLTAILKPSYAPIEQYAEMTQLRQGPWTDLYALGAVIHYLLFGVPPAPATARAVQDDAEDVETRVVPGVSPRFLEAMSWMLAIRPNGRPQSCEQLRAVLEGHAEIPLRGRPGITIPGSLVRLDSPATPIEPAANANRVNTAYMPTFMPTAHVPALGTVRNAPVDPAFGPTTFSPTTFSASTFRPATEMPTARTPPIEATPGQTMQGQTTPEQTQPVPPAPTREGQAPIATPSQAAVPSRRAAPASATTALPADARASRPAALPSDFAPSSSFGSSAGPASRPAPITARAVRAADASPSSPSSKTWLSVAAGGVAVAVAAFAAWQYSGRHGDDAALAGAVAASAGASAAAPVLPSPPPVAAAPISALATNGTSPAVSVPAESNATETVLRSSSATAPGLRSTSSLGDAASDRSSVAVAATASGARVRPPGRPVPRVDDPTTASTSSSGLRSVDGAPSGSSGAVGGERPRSGSQVSVRDAAGGQKALPMAADGEPATAREACGKRNFFSLAVCMDERCELPRYRTTAECIPILARKAERANR